MKNPPSSPSPAPTNSLGGRLWKAAMGLVLIIAGSVFVAYLWDSYERAAAMDAWVEVPTMIASFKVDDSELNQRGMTKYRVEVRYPYDYDGEQYVGSRIKKLPTEVSDPRKLKDEIEAYRPGTETVCYVDPDDPEMAVLKKDSKAGLYSIWFPCLFIVGGVGIVWSGLFGRTKRTHNPASNQE